jgi:glycosyltransferase involved in cell wall biosynthesis
VIPTPPPGRTVRVQIVLPADPERMAIGGIATFVRGFVKFAPPDFEVSMVGVSATRAVGTWRRVELEGRTVRFLPVSRGRAERRGAVPLALRFVAGLVAHRGKLALGTEILSFHRPGTDLPFRRAGAPKWRVVHLSMQDLTTEGSESRWRGLPLLLEGVERRSFRRMDRVYVVNERVASEYRERYPELADRFHYLPNWADPTVFHAETDDRRLATRSAVVSELDVDPSAELLLYAGRLEGQKNPRLLGEAFAALRSRRPAAHLVVAGAGGLESDLRAVLSRQGVADAVRFVGTVPRERLAQLMHACDVKLITSRYETGPTVGFEALACGLPIAMTDVGQVGRLVREHGAGRVAPEQTAASLADAIDWILARPPEGLRSAALLAVRPFLADRVLRAVYDDNRRLAALLGTGSAPRRRA